MPKLSLLEWVGKQRVDWRIVNEAGLSERQLDCFQLAVMEILRWKGESNLVEVFINALDCRVNGLQLRRSEPVLRMGWGVNGKNSFPVKLLESMISASIIENGYCLLHYDAYNIPFSSYYQTHRIKHWSLIVGMGDGEMTLLDLAGNPKWFNGTVGKVPLDALRRAWQCSTDFGVAVITRMAANDPKAWENEARRVVRSSIHSMKVDRGLDHLRIFIDALASRHASELVPQLDVLSFDIHYYRKLRELWKTAADHQIIPEKLRSHALQSLLHRTCKCWSMIMGGLLKWKRQPQRYSKDHIIGYFEEALKTETLVIQELAVREELWAET